MVALAGVEACRVNVVSWRTVSALLSADGGDALVRVEEISGGGPAADDPHDVTTGATHEMRLTRSRIHIVGNAWSLEFPDSTVWSGPVNGLTSSLVVVPLSEARKKQLLPEILRIIDVLRGN